ncbi:MAG: GNAT family N-acetyltransferase [Candidatus Riflebacteria bacterium]|nr:GNAT family N-acetyltransferase [Candidatus Riflebacteria bacterium]
MGEITFSETALPMILGVRTKILRPGRPIDDARFPGDNIHGTIHFAAFEGRFVIGCVTLVPSELDGMKAFQLRGMAVDDESQGSGIGRGLLSFSEETLKKKQLESFHDCSCEIILWCNARLSAVGFYQKFGWITISEIFEIEKVGPHRRMVRKICGLRHFV